MRKDSLQVHCGLRGFAGEVLGSSLRRQLDEFVASDVDTDCAHFVYYSVLQVGCSKMRGA